MVRARAPDRPLISRFWKQLCSAPTTTPLSRSIIPGELEVGRVLEEFGSCVKIATLCARRVVTSSSPRSTRWPTEVQFRRSSRRQLHAPQRPSHGERRPALRRQSARRFEAPGPWRTSSTARCNAPTTVHFSLREVRQETQIRGETRRIERVATLRAKPCSMDDTRQGAAVKSADPLMCNVRARIIEGGNKVGSCRGS